jgi:excisionase family DNA binding protein
VSGRLLKTWQVAERLGVSGETVLAWIDTRGLPAIRLSSRAIRYDESKLDAWIAERETAASPERGSASNPERRRRHSKANLPVPATPLQRAARNEEV